MHSEKVIYSLADNDNDLLDILDLQSENLKSRLKSTESQREGYVTVEHDLNLLSALNSPYKHIIARSDNDLAGYALVMERKWSKEIDVLIPMFREIDSQVYQGIELKESRYFVMGQVCVAANFRRKGIFRGLYDKMRQTMSTDFDFIITEIASDNQRSLDAHLAIGFEEFHRYSTNSNFDWVLVLQDYR